MERASNPTTAGRLDTRVSGIACGFAAALIWGGFPVMTRLGVAYSSLDMYDVTFLRFAVSGVLLAPVLLRQGLGVGPGAVALMVVGIGAPYMLVVAHGLALAPVGLFAVLTPGTMILFSVLLSAWWLRSRLPARQRFGIAAILAGACLAGYEDLRSAAGNGPAIGLFVLGGLLWAVYTVSTRLFAIGALHATAIVSVVSALIYTPVYFAMKGSAIFQAPAGTLLIQAVYQGVLVSILALYLYSKGVAVLGPAIGASFAALVPVLAVIEAWLLLGERPAVPSLFGLAIVTVGMVSNLLAPQDRG